MVIDEFNILKRKFDIAWFSVRYSLVQYCQDNGA